MDKFSLKAEKFGETPGARLAHSPDDPDTRFTGENGPDFQLLVSVDELHDLA